MLWGDQRSNRAEYTVALQCDSADAARKVSDAVKQVVQRKMLVLGLQHFSAADLRALEAANQSLDIRVLGLVTIASDVSPELALATIASLDVLGALHASPAVKTALAARLR